MELCTGEREDDVSSVGLRLLSDIMTIFGTLAGLLGFDALKSKLTTPTADDGDEDQQ